MKGRLLVLLVSLLALSACSSCAGMTTNVAETSPTQEDLALRTRTYERPVLEVRDIARGIVADFPRWELTSERMCCGAGVILETPVKMWPFWEGGEVPDTQGALMVEITTLVFRFVDDMTIFLEPVDAEHTRVNVHSASRMGKGDLGVNARNIGRFLKELDARVASARKVSKGTP